MLAALPDGDTDLNEATDDSIFSKDLTPILVTTVQHMTACLQNEEDLRKETDFVSYKIP